MIAIKDINLIDFSNRKTILTMAPSGSNTLRIRHPSPCFLSPQRIMKQYQCIVCGFIYDEAQGIPEDGIPPGTRWEDVPATWECPDCGVTKSDFEMVAL